MIRSDIEHEDRPDCQCDECFKAFIEVTKRAKAEHPLSCMCWPCKQAWKEKNGTKDFPGFFGKATDSSPPA